MTQVLEQQTTEHPYIVIEPTLNEPMIAGTQIGVRLIAYYYRRQTAIEEIEEAHPELSPAAIHSAISYYLDHREEMDSSPIEAELAEAVAIHERNETAGSWVSSAEMPIS